MNLTNYENNFGEYPSGDITKIDAKDIPDFDILCGGFPCQSFSVIGRKDGFSDDRGQIIFHIARILEETQPKCFLLETSFLGGSKNAISPLNTKLVSFASLVFL